MAWCVPWCNVCQLLHAHHMIRAELCFLCAFSICTDHVNLEQRAGSMLPTNVGSAPRCHAISALQSSVAPVHCYWLSTPWGRIHILWWLTQLRSAIKSVLPKSNKSLLLTGNTHLNVHSCVEGWLHRTDACCPHLHSDLPHTRHAL